VTRKETVMSQEEPTIQDDTAAQTAVQAPGVAAYEPEEEQEEWFDAPAEPELPRRPRRRLLGVGANPLPLALIGVLLTACGFIGGVLVERGQSSSSSGSSSTGGLASRFAALRAGSGGTAGRAGASGSGASAFLGAGAAGGAGAGAGGRAGSTFGQVAYVSGHTLYVTNAEGNTVKVMTSAASTVTKTVKADVKGIHPGETVVVTGSPGANGSVRAETIRIGEAGALGGGLGALFGGGRSAAGFGATGGGGGSEGVSRSGSSGGGAGGEQALFGK
jgi:hypothetical protein